MRSREVTTGHEEPSTLTRGLGLLDATMIVISSMIGSGIFIVSAESARLVGSPGWLLAAWTIAGVMTITGALSDGSVRFRPRNRL
jgi:APA family basic amino acid/polyamine antiporter